MGRSDSARFLSLLSRRSLGSNVRNPKDGAPYAFDNLLHRGFFSWIYKSCFSSENVNFGNVKQIDGVRNGALHGGLGIRRFVHATGSTSTAVQDYYDILGVSKNASSSEIKRAYYELAKKLHPDKNEDDSNVVRKFQEVQQAFEALKDDVHDGTINDEEQDPAVGRPRGFDVVQYHNGFVSEILDYDNFKKILRKKGLRGEDVKVALDLSFMEAVNGCSKTITFETAVPCEACGGIGLPPGTEPETCKQCAGSGMRFSQRQEGQIELQCTCTSCWGSGNENFCKSCRGDGVVRGSKTVNIYVEPGTEDGQTLTLYKSGGADPKEDQPGDLYITFNVLRVSNSFSPFKCISHSQ